jgi:hypothetical protein
VPRSEAQRRAERAERIESAEREALGVARIGFRGTYEHVERRGDATRFVLPRPLGGRVG